MTINAENIAVCQQALYLLRQDVGLPSVAEAPTDESLEWQKCRLAFDSALVEVWNAHDWNAELGLTGADLDAAHSDVSNWSASMRTTLAYRIAAELAIPLAGRVEDMKNWLGLYAQRLAQTRVLSLENERRAVMDRTHNDILATIVPRFDSSDDYLPRSIRSITARADALADSARYSILADHAWNFARSELRAASCPVPHGCAPYAFAAEVPGGCVHIEAVFTHGARLADWKIFDGRTIAAREPIDSIVYVRDDKKPERWPPLVRRAFVLRLAADVAQTEVPRIFEAIEQKAAAALAEAKVRDARESNTPRDAWGRNHYVEAMHGNLSDGPRLPRHSFHGLV